MSRRQKEEPEGLTDQEWFEAETLYNMMQDYEVTADCMDPADLTLIDRWLAEQDLEMAEQDAMTLDEYHELMAQAHAEEVEAGWEEVPGEFDYSVQLPFDFDTEDQVSHKRRRRMYDHNDRWSKGWSADPKRNSLICPPPGLIRVTNEDGSTAASFRIEARDGWWFRNARMAYPEGVHVVGDEVVIDIPLAQCKTAITTTSPGWSSCTFDSTRDYLKSLFGIELHMTDKDWMAKHPHAEEMGVPAEYTPGAIQGLIEPYGMGVSRVRVKAGSWFTGDALNQWMEALGVNPMAMSDHTTSNVEAAETLGMTIEEADALWRFEFEPHPFRPGILGERMDLSIASGVHDGKRGGHFRYLAPRQGNGSWFISLQLANIKEIEYHVQPVLPEYVPRPDSLRLNIYQVKVPNGPDVDNAEWYARWIAEGAPGRIEEEPSVAGTIVGAVKDLLGGKTVHGAPAADIRFHPSEQVERIAKMYETDDMSKSKMVRCQSCDQWRSERIIVEGLEEVCMPCYIDAWKPYKCSNPKCEVSLDVDHLPVIHLTGLCWSCPKCQTRFANGKDTEINFLAGQIIDPKDVHKAGSLSKVITVAPDGSKITHWTVH